MYEITVDSHFDAAHCLKGYSGECSRRHGHTWSVSVTVAVNVLGELGFSIDFKDIESTLDEIVAKFDHQDLNTLEEFSEVNPTAENIARLIFELLSEKVNNETSSVLSVTVGESYRSRVTYRKNE